MGYDTASVCDWNLTFRENIASWSSRVKMSKNTL